MSFLKKLFWTVLFAIVAAIIVSISVSNRESVIFSLSPLPFEMEIPLFMLLLGAGLVGLLFGGITVWLSDSVDRQNLRIMARDKEQLIAENRELSLKLEKQKAGEADTSTMPDAPGFLKIENRRAS